MANVHDVRVLKNSSLFQRMEGSWRPIPKAVILDVTGYQSLELLITPAEINVDVGVVAVFNRAHKTSKKKSWECFRDTKGKVFVSQPNSLVTRIFS